MSRVIVTKDKEIELDVDGKLYRVRQGDDGSLYIEAAGQGSIEVTVSDVSEAQVTAIGHLGQYRLGAIWLRPVDSQQSSHA